MLRFKRAACLSCVCVCVSDWWVWWWDWGNGHTGVCWRRRSGQTPLWSVFGALNWDWPLAASATHSQMLMATTPKGSLGRTSCCVIPRHFCTHCTHWVESCNYNTFVVFKTLLIQRSRLVLIHVCGYFKAVFHVVSNIRRPFQYIIKKYKCIISPCF